MVIKTRVFKIKSLFKSGYSWVVQEENSHNVTPWLDVFSSRREARAWAKTLRNI